MSNSSLVSYVAISPNRTIPRNGKISKIVIHHMAGNLGVETCGNVFAPASRKASSNYSVGSDGRIGMYCEEKDRAWTTGHQIDHQAVTIEVADDVIGNGWHSSDAAMKSLVLLCADICRRNGIANPTYTGDGNGTFLMHKWYQATDCPGAYLESQFPWIAQEVNKILSGESEKPQMINATIQSNTGADYMRLTLEEVSDGVYKIKDKANGFHLTASAGTADANVDFRGFDCGDYQLWKVVKKKYELADYTMLESVAAPGMYLSVEKNGIGSNNLKLYADLHNQKQKFYVREETDGTTLLIHAYTGKCVAAKE